MPDPSTVPAAHRRAMRSVWAILAAALALVILLGDGTQLAALQKMAGYSGGKSDFAQVQQYLENLRDALIPLALPLGVIGLTGGGVAYMVGNAMAQRILGGVLIGLALVLTGPSIVA